MSATENVHFFIVTPIYADQGGAVSNELLQYPEEYSVRALSRAPQSPAAQQLKRDGAEVYNVDFDNPSELDAAFESCWGVFAMTTSLEWVRLCLHHAPTEFTEAPRVKERSLTAVVDRLKARTSLMLQRRPRSSVSSGAPCPRPRRLVGEDAQLSSTVCTIVSLVAICVADGVWTAAKHAVDQYIRQKPEFPATFLYLGYFYENLIKQISYDPAERQIVYEQPIVKETTEREFCYTHHESRPVTRPYSPDGLCEERSSCDCESDFRSMGYSQEHTVAFLHVRCKLQNDSVGCPQ